MKRTLIAVTIILLLGCNLDFKDRTTNANRKMPFSNIKDQPSPENIIRENPIMTDNEWTREWFEIISAHDIYLQNYIRMLVATTGVKPKVKCDLNVILQDVKEPKLPILKGIDDPEEVNLILAKSVRNLYDTNVNLLKLLHNCK